MDIYGLDFETFYDREYSLRKMTPVEYVLDPRFEAIGCAVKPPDQKSYWVEGPDLPKFFAQADKKAGYVTHNALFDMCVTSWRYEWRPRLMIDSMGIARACLGHILRSVSLKSVLAHLELGVKGTVVNNVLGMNLAAIKAQPALYKSYQEYSCDDCDGAVAIFYKLVQELKLFPISELATMDMVQRMALQPRFHLDMSVLAEHLNQVKADKAQLLAQAGLTPDALGKVPDLMSNDKFAVLLESLGVDPPKKTSPATGLETFAFAKSDPEFIALADDDNPAVQALVGARLGHKSTLEETRTERMLKISRLWWPERGAAAFMPMPTNFSAAHTHRLGGAWKLNVQNLPKNLPGKQSQLRRALIAGPGETVLVADASQIEARIGAWLAGQEELLQAFANGDDVYSEFASEVFGHPVNRKLPDRQNQGEGFVGKTGILGLQFGVGWVKFQRTVKLDSKKYTGNEIILSDEVAQRTVNTYRLFKYPEIPVLWRSLNEQGIRVLANGGDFSLGPCQFEKGAILLPNGLRLKYHDLQYKRDGWSYTYGGKPKRLYGGALLENIVQALDRCIVFDAAVRIQKRIAEHDLWLNLQAHDELVYVLPHERVDVVKAIVLEEMSARPSWAPDLPLKAEANTGPSYGDAK